MADVRILLTDKAIARLPVPKEGWYLARDTELKGFFVVVGKRKRTFTVQGDLRQGKKRVSSVRVAIGDTVKSRHVRRAQPQRITWLKSAEANIRKSKSGAWELINLQPPRVMRPPL